MQHYKKLKAKMPRLVKQYSEMNNEQLINQICAEVIDLMAMEERVQLFMNECTKNFSKTNYTIESLKTMISDKQEHDINEFCADIIDGQTDDQILADIKERAKQFNA